MKEMKVTMLLADHAQAVQGKLYIIGGGWSITGPGPTPSAIAIKIDVPWDETNRNHSLKLELFDADMHPVQVPTPVGEAPVVLKGNFEVGRPAGITAGTPIDVSLAFNMGPLPLPPGNRYIWKLSINDKSDELWQLAFSTRPAPPDQQTEPSQ